MFRFILYAALICLCALFMAKPGGLNVSHAQSSDFRMDGKFTGKKKDADSGAPASNLSGGACMPVRANGTRTCLFIDDETRHAQFATLKGSKITPGKIIRLIGKQASDDTLGMAPDPRLFDEPEDFGELDGEAVAYVAPYFYVTGSHGFSRKKGKFAPSSFILARIRVDEQGRPAGKDGKALPEDGWDEAVETTYRLSDVLASTDPGGAYFAKDLSENGLNVEGLAVIGGRLVVGLRAPVVGDAAHLVVTDIEPLFAPGHKRLSRRADVMALPLGKDTGIRDLAGLGDGRLLVLAGPAQEQPMPYALFLAKPEQGASPVHLADIETPDTPSGERSRAEAVLVLKEEGARLRLLILFDGIPNGGMTEMTVTLPKP
jgi:hypothetical protein